MSRKENSGSAATRMIAALIVLIVSITWCSCGTTSNSVTTSTSPTQSGPTTTTTTAGGGASGSSSSGSTSSGGGTGSTGGYSNLAFAFVYNSVGHTVTTFTTNNDGSLTPTANPPNSVINAGGFGIAVAAGDLWLSTNLPSQLASYQINSDGSLKQLNIVQTPSFGRLHAAGNFLYEPANSGQLLGYAVTSSGSVSAVQGSPYSNSFGFEDVATTADGKMLYATVGTSTGDILQAYI